MQPLGAIPAPDRPGHIRRRTAGGTGSRRGRPTGYTRRAPGGRHTGRFGCRRPPGRDPQLDAVRGELIQHLAGEGIGAVRRPNVRASGRVCLCPGISCSAFGEPAAPAGRQGRQAEQKGGGQTGGQTGGQQPGAPPDRRPSHLMVFHSGPLLVDSAPVFQAAEDLSFIRRSRGSKGSAEMKIFPEKQSAEARPSAAPPLGRSWIIYRHAECPGQSIPSCLPPRFSSQSGPWT